MVNRSANGNKAAASVGSTRVQRVRASFRDRASAIQSVGKDGARVSVWLYVAGLCVTLSALYAVNYGLEDTRFAMLTYGLAISGYVFSYISRARQVNLQSIQMPLIVCIGLLILANVSGGGLGWMVPDGAADNRALGLQALVAWGAIIHTFLLGSDASVLFACVPGMTMLALVSTMNADTEIQNAFLVFIGAATFMMVHENYLRTRSVAAVSGAGNAAREKRLFGAQVQLAAACLAGALVLANIVAVPIRAVGQSLSDNGSINSFNAAIVKPKQMIQATALIDENTTLELAVGPTPESDAALMTVQSSEPLYWRGTTFDHYTGHSFENRDTTKTTLTARPDTGQAQMAQSKTFTSADVLSATGAQIYDVPANPLDLADKDMRDSRQVKQHVSIIGGVFRSLFGAAQMRRVKPEFAGSITYQNSGVLLTTDLPINASYDVVSQVPTQDEKIRNAAPSDSQAVPQAIRDKYLQTVRVNDADADSIAKLVERIAPAGMSNYEKAQAIKTYIASNCKYNLQAPPKPADRDVVAWFLFDRQEGYCDSFAAAMTVLCRYARIPARLATGFLTGEPQSTPNTYLVRQKHKHAWAEVFFAGVGWVPFDATEGSVDISDHSGTQKAKSSNFIAWLTSHGLLPPTLAFAFVAMLGYVVRTEVAGRVQPRRRSAAPGELRPAANQQIVTLYAQTQALLAKRGMGRLMQQTPDEYASRVAEILHPTLPAVGPELSALTALYTRFRYGRDTAAAADVQAAQAHLAAVQTALKTMRAKERTPRRNMPQRVAVIKGAKS